MVVVEDQLLVHRRLDLRACDGMRDRRHWGPVQVRRHVCLRRHARHGWAGPGAVERRRRRGPAVAGGGPEGVAGMEALAKGLLVWREAVRRPMLSTCR